MSSNGVPRDPDDFFADTRMSFGDHIEDLRAHLWRALVGFGVCLFVSFFFGHIVLRWITAPVRGELDRFYDRHAVKVLKKLQTDAKLMKLDEPGGFIKVYFLKEEVKALFAGKDLDIPQPRWVSKAEQEKREREKTEGATGSWYRRVLGWWNILADDEETPKFDKNKKYREIPVQDKDKLVVGVWMSQANPLSATAEMQAAIRKLLDFDNPTTLSVQESFVVWFKVCIVCGFVLGFPWIARQVWMFVAAGLYPHEKRLVYTNMWISIPLFLAGVAICEIFVIPKAIRALLWFNELMGFRPDVRLNEFLGFAIWMPVVFGLSFQTPLVMLFLYRIGVMELDSFRKRRKLAWFIMLVFAAIITPSTDAVSLMFMWVPMSALFEVGIWMIRLWPNKPAIDIDVPEPDELVEV